MHPTSLLHEDPAPGLRTLLFRRSFELTGPTTATLSIYAEQRYHAWVNGHYLGRGPAFHHPTVLPVDSRDIAPLLRPGRNVVAVLVQYTDVSMHNHVNTGEPGLAAVIEIDGQPLGDDGWRMTDRSGWRNDSPRRSWAVDYVEEYEMAAGTQGWQAIDFDDSVWRAPLVRKPATKIAGATFIDRPIPPLRWNDVSPVKLIGAYTAAPPDAGRPANSAALANGVMGCPMALIEAAVPDDGRDFTIDRPMVVSFDLGRQYVGQVCLECDCPSDGVIDVGFSEVFENGRPVLTRKGVGYCDRIYATKGELTWQPVQFSGFRYVTVAFRNFTGPVKVKRVFARATEPDLDWRGAFTSSDERLNGVFDLCALTQRVGTQDGQMDCPTREQAPYIGDGVLTARWFAQLTGDVRHYRYLIREQFRRQAANGLLRSSIFSGSNDTIIDYTLLAVIAVRDYLQFTGDRETVRELLEPCRRAFQFFDAHRKDGGLCTWTMPDLQYGRPWEKTFDASNATFNEGQRPILFIDHSGLGWHNKLEAGIDRRGPSAALNALIVQAKRALADLEEDGTALRADADQLAGRIRATFFDPTRRMFTDIERGRQISEQTNTWCIAARCCDDETARVILTKLLTSDSPYISRNGPYFWAYLYPELARLGLHQLAVDKTRTLWGPMLDGGATTLWESFLGDDLDTWCHPWSGAPLEFLLTQVLGLPGHGFRDQNIVLRPRTDLLSQASGSIYTRLGWFSIEWNKDDVRFTAPPGVKVTIMRP